MMSLKINFKDYSPIEKNFFIEQSAHLPQMENEIAFEKLLITEILFQDIIPVIVE